MLKAVCDFSLKGPIIYVRHAQTTYNTYSEEVKLSKQIRLEEKFLDCILSEEGRLQAEGFYQKIKDFDIKYCFVSPLTRTLETSFLALNRHKNANDIEVIVHPLLNEIISSTQTITSNIKSKKEIFNLNSPIRYNWNVFDTHFQDETEQDHYYFNYVDNQIVETQADLINEIKKSPSPGLISRFLGAFWQHGYRPETFNHLLSRSNAFKKYLIEFVKEKQLKDNEKIIIFTHLGFIRMSTSTKASPSENLTEFPLDGFCPKNCESVSCIIEDE
jgi:broad specificity phosphatase PhoE